MEQSIKELISLKNNINQRIEELRKKADVDIFEERLYSATDELKRVIEDRRENEDDKSLWEIYYELSAMEGTIIRTVSGFDE